MRDYRLWHREYDDPASPLAARLEVVRRRFSEALTASPPGPVRVISMCAGEGRDVLGVLPTHPRREDVSALLVEIEPDNVRVARAAAADAGLTKVDVVQADAAVTDAYSAHVPAQVVLACGIFGNVSDEDVERTVRSLPMLCARGAVVIWTRHRGEPDLTPSVREWFGESGFEELHFDALANETRSSIGTARLVGEPVPLRPRVRLFTFVR